MENFYKMKDYDDYAKNLTIKELIDNLKHIRRGYIGDYNYTGRPEDFDRYKLHATIFKV